MPEIAIRSSPSWKEANQKGALQPAEKALEPPLLSWSRKQGIERIFPLSISSKVIKNNKILREEDSIKPLATM